MKRILFFAISAFVLAADQLSKAWITRRLPVGGSLNVLPPYVHLYHATNDGVAWSLFRGHTQLFSAVAIAFCIGVLILGRTAMQRSYTLTAAMAMLLGGSVGNLIDRLRFHYVVDFIDIYLGRFYRWPTFNVADSSISIGMIVLVTYFWLSERRALSAGHDDAAGGPEQGSTRGGIQMDDDGHASLPAMTGPAPTAVKPAP